MLFGLNWPHTRLVILYIPCHDSHIPCYALHELELWKLALEVCWFAPDLTAAHFYTLHSTNLKGVYWFHLVCLSICPSVHLWTESCPLCIFCNTCRIHFLCTHLIKQLQKVFHMYHFFSKFRSLKFWQILSICNFDFVKFDLGSNMNWSVVWVIMGRQGVSSECRRSSCSSI